MVYIEVHVPVLRQEVVQLLRPVPGGVFLDATVGAGGHAGAMLERIRPGGRLVGLDRDPEILRLARGVLGESSDLTLVHGNFARAGEVLRKAGAERLDGILMDLGPSSLQLDSPARGFSFRLEGPLDMRMDPGAPMSAREAVNEYSASRLEEIFCQLGEERYARRIARRIEKERADAPIETTTRLAELVERAVPKRHFRIHPATRVFQALRIHVNGELDALAGALDQLPALLAPGGRIAVIAFHSLEDRIVKQTFRALVADGRFSAVTRKPVRPSTREQEANRRCRSARLRVLERA